MKESITAYYIAERQEAVFMLVFGSATVILSFVLFFQTADGLFIGAAYSVLPIGVLEILSGSRNLVFFKRRKERIEQIVQNHPKRAIDIEKTRVLNAQIRFKFYKIAEQLLLFIGMLLLIVGGVFMSEAFLAGSGCGLLIMSAVLFVQDLFAEWRSNIYLSELEMLIKK